jgi:tRNA threonylcarbamoyladenosine biosynthesis protein TsaE
MTHVTIVASPDSGVLLTRDFIWRDEAECSALAAQLAAHLAHRLATRLTDNPRDQASVGASFYIELHGTLGAGKTTFTRHLLRALGVAGRIKSPSYAVVEPHELPGLDIQHFDFYRFNDPQEWEDAGFRDLFAAPGLKIAEWPEKAQGLLPVADLRIHIQPDGGGAEARQVRAQALSRSGQEALKTLPASGEADGAASDRPGVPAHG